VSDAEDEDRTCSEMIFRSLLKKIEFGDIPGFCGVFLGSGRMRAHVNDIERASGESPLLKPVL